MTSISANEAKNRFGELLDNARREPITIEKHGRPVAVVISTEEYEELRQIKLEKLRSEIQIGIDQLESGDAKEFDEAALLKLIEAIKQHP